MNRAADTIVSVLVIVLWALGSLILAVSWVVGVVLANGIWSTVAAIFVPPWGWYLIAEAWMKSVGWT